MTIGQSIAKAVYMDKQHAELDALLSSGALMSGNAFSSVLVLKGNLTHEDLTNGLMSGKDGEALKKALLALQYEPQDWCVLATSAINNQPLDTAVFRRAVLQIAPDIIIICDDEAQMQFRNSFAQELVALPNLDDALLQAGNVVHILGIKVMNLGGFEQALAHPELKRVMWSRLKCLPCQTKPY